MSLIPILPSKEIHHFAVNGAAGFLYYTKHEQPREIYGCSLKNTKSSFKLKFPKNVNFNDDGKFVLRMWFTKDDEDWWNLYILYAPCHMVQLKFAKNSNSEVVATVPNPSLFTLHGIPYCSDDYHPRLTSWSAEHMKGDIYAMEDSISAIFLLKPNTHVGSGAETGTGTISRLEYFSEPEEKHFSRSIVHDEQKGDLYFTSKSSIYKMEKIRPSVTPLFLALKFPKDLVTIICAYTGEWIVEMVLKDRDGLRYGTNPMALDSKARRIYVLTKEGISFFKL